MNLKNSEMTTPPAFFKVFIPECCSQRMQIPSAFTSFMRRLLPDNATFLRDRNGNVWPVEVIREGSDWYFNKGWVRFVEDNGIDVGDFLVFQFNGDYFFDFKHFCKSACEKENAGSFNFTVKLEELEEGEDNEEEEVGKSDACIGEKEEDYDEEEEEDDAYDDNEEDEDYEEEEDDAYDDDDEEDEEYEEEEEADDEVVEDEEDEEEDIDVARINMILSKKETESSSAGAKKVGTSKNLGNKGKAAVIDEAGLENRAKMVGGTSDADIFESGLVARPRNPYFIAPCKPKKQKLRSDQCIPVDVVKDHGLKFPPEMDIHDEEGRKWRSEVVVWKDGRVVLKKGWKAFCKWNHVKLDDKCLCEFVLDGRQRVLFLKVRIFRACMITAAHKSRISQNCDLRREMKHVKVGKKN